MRRIGKIMLLMLIMSITLLIIPACSGSGGGGYSRATIHHGYGYRGYRGHPWGYDGVYIPGGGGGWGGGGPSGPVAVPLPEMGMPDFG